MYIILLLIFNLINYLPISLSLNEFGPLSAEQELQRNEGEKQYLTLKSNANLPQYGSCWTQAITELDNTCAHLTDTTQAALALKFTKCFIEMSGGTADNNPNLCEIADSVCMNQLPERVFQAYTHFYTHTQNICFYLMHQVWHDETEQTINLLRTHSQSVSKQLEIAGRLQINLLQQQREGLKVQRQLVEHGMNLSELLHESRGNLARLTADLKNSTIEHGRQLADLFKRLAQLHNWFIGEYSFIEQIIYYTGTLLVIMIMTTSKRTENSRFVLYLLAGLNLMLEIVFQQFLRSDGFDNDSQVKFFANIWMVRKLFVGVLVVVYVTMATLYVDHHRLTLNLLTKIHEQNAELLRLLLQVIENSSERGLRNMNGNSIELIRSIGSKEFETQTNNERVKLLGIEKSKMRTIEELKEINNNVNNEVNVVNSATTSRLRPRRRTPQIA